MNSWNFSLEPSARPPDTMILAAVSSGRADLVSSAPSKLESPESACATAFSMVALPPVVAALAKAVPRTVMTFLASLERTVAMALPA